MCVRLSERTRPLNRLRFLEDAVYGTSTHARRCARVTRISLRIGHRVRKSSNAHGRDNVCSEVAYRQVYTLTYTARIDALERQRQTR